MLDRPYYYRLEGKKPVPCDPSQVQIGQHVAKDRITDSKGNEILVSTVFLPLDHGFGYSSEPILFETMVFGGEGDGYQERYTTWDLSETGHSEILAKAKAEEWDD